MLQVRMTSSIPVVHVPVVHVPVVRVPVVHVPVVTKTEGFKKPKVLMSTEGADEYRRT